MKKIRLIKGLTWRTALRWFSVQAGILGTSISLGYMSMYDQLKETIPPQWMAGITASVFILGIIGRVVAQGKPK